VLGVFRVRYLLVSIPYSSGRGMQPIDSGLSCQAFAEARALFESDKVDETDGQSRVRAQLDHENVRQELPCMWRKVVIKQGGVAFAR